MSTQVRTRCERYSTQSAAAMASTVPAATAIVRGRNSTMRSGTRGRSDSMETVLPAPSAADAGG